MAVVTSLGFVGCSDEEIGILQEESQESGVKALSNKRSYAEALEIAVNSIKMLESDETATRSSRVKREVDFSQKPIPITDMNLMTRTSASEENDTLIYIFNFKGNQGYAAVSTEKATEGLIAVVEEGTYDQSEISDTYISQYLKAAKRYICAKRDSITPRPNRAHRACYTELDTISQLTISPRIDVKWGQNNHEGRYCPNYTSGCTITAGAMIMSYFEYPTGISLSYDGAPQSFITLNWSGIKTYISPLVNSPCLLHTCNNAYHRSVGYLCRQLGEIANATYYSDRHTSTSTEDIRDALSYYGYTASPIGSYQYLANTYTLENQLSNGCLILMTGKNSSGEGHAWVVDGIKRLTTHYKYYEYGFTNGLPDPPILVDEQYNTYRYNHINWGYYGRNNGYFNDGVFSFFSTPYEYDDNNLNGTPSDYSNFTYENGIFAYDLLYFSVYKD